MHTGARRTNAIVTRDRIATTARAIAERFACVLECAVAVLWRAPESNLLVRIATEDANPTAFGSSFTRALPVDHEAVARALRGIPLVHAPNEPSQEGPFDWSNTRAFALFPLTVDGSLVGLIACARACGAAPVSPLEIAVAVRFVERAATELANAVRDAGPTPGGSAFRFQAVASDLADAVSVAHVAQVLVELGVAAANGIGGIFFAFETNDSLPELTHARRPPFAIEALRDALQRDHALARTLTCGEAISLESRSAIELVIGRLINDDVESCLVLPLHVDNEALGVFVVALGGPDDLDIRSSLLMLMRTAARTLRRVRTREREQRVLHRLEYLAHATAYPFTDLDATIDNILDSFVPELADGAILELSDTGKRYERHAESAGTAALTYDLEVRGHRVGTLQLFRDAPIRTRPEEVFLGELARRAALAIDTAQLLRAREAAVRVRDDFIAIAGHELRTPLTTLRMMLFTLAKLGRDAPFDAASAMRQLARLEHLVNGLLEVSRSGDLEVALELEETDLVALVREIAAPMASVEVRAGEGEIRGVWDRFRLGQVLTNLFINATKYGRGEPVEVVIDADEARARVVVRDRGIGISAEELERIFGRFERAVSSRNYGGLGLGLWISRRIARAHGGDILVKSELDWGSEFTLELPLVVA